MRVLLFLEDALQLFLRLPDGHLSTNPEIVPHPCGNGIEVIKDWDGNGRADLLCNKWGELHLWRQLPNGTFAGPTLLYAEAVGGETLSDIADWDGDGLMDMLLSNGQVALQRANLSWEMDPHVDLENFSTFEQAVVWSNVPQVYPSELKIVDWDRDGVLDVVAIDHFGSGTDWAITPIIRGSDSTMKASEKIEFTYSPLLPPAWPRGMQLVDWDGDGFAELLALRREPGPFFTASIEMWSSGCLPASACTLNGACHAATSECKCYAGYSAVDCSRCAAGYYTDLTLTCRACAGFGGSNVCAGRGACYDDHAAQEAGLRTGNGSCACYDPNFGGEDEHGLSTCQLGTCSVGYVEVGGHCVLDQLYLIMASIFAVSLLALFLLPPCVLGWAVPIEDICLDGGVLVVTTATPHYILQRPWVRPMLRCVGTGHPVVADSKTFVAKPVGSHPNHLVLMSGTAACTEKADASCGFLQLSRPRAALCTGYILPFGVLWAALLVTAMAVHAFFEISVTHTLTSLGGAATVSALIHLWLQHRVRTPLAMRLAEFSQDGSAEELRACPHIRALNPER